MLLYFIECFSTATDSFVWDVIRYFKTSKLGDYKFETLLYNYP